MDWENVVKEIIIELTKMNPDYIMPALSESGIFLGVILIIQGIDDQNHPMVKIANEFRPEKDLHNEKKVAMIFDKLVKEARDSLQ